VAGRRRRRRPRDRRPRDRQGRNGLRGEAGGSGLTTAQRRALDDEAALVGAVMEAAVTLTMGPVTVGPHA
jgi:hypothetical protein